MICDYPINVSGNNVILYMDYLNKFINHSNMTWDIENRKDAYKIVKLTQWELNDNNLRFTKANREATKKQIDFIKIKYLTEKEK